MEDFSEHASFVSCNKSIEYLADHSQATWNMSMLQTHDVMKSAQASMEKKSPKTVAFSKL